MAVIKVAEFRSMYGDQSSIQETLRRASQFKGEPIVIDFSNVDIITGSHRAIAEMLLTYRFGVRGLSQKDAKEIKIWVTKLTAKSFDSIDEVKKWAMKYIKEGDILILKEGEVENVCIINKIIDRGIILDKLPRGYFRLDSSTLPRLRTEISWLDIMNKVVIFRRPKEDEMSFILQVLKKHGYIK